MAICWVPARGAGSWRPTGHMAIIGSVNLLDEQDAPKGADNVAPPFEDRRLRRDDLCCLSVVYAHFFAVEDGEVSGVTYFARAHEAIECDVRHHVKGAARIAEVVPHGCCVGGAGFLPCRYLENLGGRLAREFEAAAVFADAGCCAGVHDGGGDGSVHYSSSRLLVARVDLRGDDVVVPLVEGQAGVAEVAVLLIMSGHANLLDLGADVDDTLVGDVRICLLVCKQFIC